MRNSARLLLSTLVFVLGMTPALPALFPSAHALCAPAETGTHRASPDLFHDLLGKDPAESAQKVERAFHQLFYGDSLRERVYYPVPGTKMAYIEDVLHSDVRTEGMSYGMMIAVQLDKKEEFDRLWTWAKTYMQFAEGPSRNYFAWHCTRDGRKLDSSAASDGEEWFVTALLFASARWGDGDGIHDYNREAQTILETMLHKEEEPDHGRIRNMFSRAHHQVVFVPNDEASVFTDPSYHLPHFYELWAERAERDQEFWKEAARASRAFLKKAVHPKTGLAPEYATFDGRPHAAPWNEGAVDFRYDAWRVAMNVAVDHLWFGRDPWAVAQSNRLLDFFYAQGIGRYGTLFTLDGKELLSTHSPGLVAMNAAACLASTRAHRKDFLREFWDLPVPSGQGRYYDGMLYMLALLQTTGNFRIYAPDTLGGEQYLSFSGGIFTIASARAGVAPIVVDAGDHAGVKRAARSLLRDIESVTGQQPLLHEEASLLPVRAAKKSVIIIGTLGHSALIDALVKRSALDTSGLTHQWEACAMQVIRRPFPGIDRALVIAGSDKRGTIFGIYDLSQRIGVSAWHYWADVPAKHHDALYIAATRHYQAPPKVKYRGIFINDEAPALSGWAEATFGGFNHRFYEHVYELILRMKGNYLWPAMWGRSLFDDDSSSARMADEYGIVLGTSHHEPMVRSHVEWARYGKGPWNYDKNDTLLRAFWKRGIERMDGHETIVTIGMRGDGDEPMTEGANIALLERIVKDQRSIIHDVTGKDPSAVPQLWALYKEVQEYYDRGMRVPDDVTLLLCDDNWGNIRKLPRLTDAPRTGGSGIYYHFDYVGDPRNYKWINTNQISRTWEQMHLAYEYGAHTIWIVNVGDIKPMEFPTEFFLDYAWDPEKIHAKDLPSYARRWAARQFGHAHADEIGDLLMRCTQYNSRRKPELLSGATYSLTDYHEAETVVADFAALSRRALALESKMPAQYRDAYFQLVLHPILAAANLNEMYYAAGMNHLSASQGRAMTNAYAARVKELFGNDSLISFRYNHEIAHGKWVHMMDQTHIGYTSWQQPEKDTMPPVETITLGSAPDLGVSIEGSTRAWPGDTTKAMLPESDSWNKQTRSIEIFNRGAGAVECRVTPSASWITVMNARDTLTVSMQTRLMIGIDYSRAPKGISEGSITIADRMGKTAIIHLPIRNLGPAPIDTSDCFVENAGAVSIEAEHYTGMTASEGIFWMRIPELGRTLSGMTSQPVTHGPPALPLDPHSAHLEYRFYTFSPDTILRVQSMLSPTLNFHNTQTGLRLAVSIDDETPQILSMHDPKTAPSWSEMVSTNCCMLTSTHAVKAPGMHRLNVWAIDPGVVFQKFVIDCGGLKPSYLGPPESLRMGPSSSSHKETVLW